MSNKEERVVNGYIDTKFNDLVRKSGRSREEVYRKMKADEGFATHVKQELLKEMHGSTNNEVRDAAKRLKGE